ncbi:unnamed protein product [Microthlaspi erraticum]|uniref:Uncharacterized protein n=1 Tax=Microthlaspi erraticum TaxID=1685480 RepID=A0A6D2KHP9_9BRAS|nr:unnamed protein product [Microthlaspi erraticum]
MPLEVCNLESSLGDITFVLKTGPQPAERTRPDRKGIGFARPSPGPIRPHDRTVRAGRQWTTIDREHHITADPDGRPHPLHGRPELREQEAHLCSFDYSGPFHLNRLVEDLGHYKYSFLASLEERAAVTQRRATRERRTRELPLEGSSIVLLLSHCFP